MLPGLFSALNDGLFRFARIGSPCEQFRIRLCDAFQVAIGDGLQVFAESRLDHANNQLLGLMDTVACGVDAEIVVDGGTPLIAGVAVVEVSVRRCPRASRAAPLP